MGDGVRLMIVNADTSELEMMSLAFSDVDDIELVAQTNIVSEAFELMRATEPDVVLIRLVLSDNNGLDLLEKIHSMVKPVAVVVQTSFLTPAISQKCTEFGVCNILPLPYSFKMLQERLLFAAEQRVYDPKPVLYNYESEQIYLSAITELMQEIGLPVRYSGYKFIRAACVICMSSGLAHNRLSIEVYPNVAQQFGSVPTRVERDIRTIIEAYWKMGGNAIIERKLGVCMPEVKMTNSAFLALIVDQASYKLNRRKN